ncbi:hypothetical protein ACYOEI_24480 [Singulisphaera rosea]
MSEKQRRCRPCLEGLEDRLALSRMGGTVAAAVAPTPAQQNTLNVLQAFTQAYESRAGQPNYNASLDLNHNGQIGQDDGRLLLRNLTPVSPRIPLKLYLTLAPQDNVRGNVSTNLGGNTYNKNPTILGHTTPGALIFTGTGTLDLKLRGPAAVADAKGNFVLRPEMTDGINQFDVQVVDAYGRQTLRAYPIAWLGFAAYSDAHPKKT